MTLITAPDRIPRESSPVRECLFGLPSSRPGCWSLRLVIAFGLLFGFFPGLTKLGHAGGATFFERPLPYVSLLVGEILDSISGRLS
jgi:hypothetical protein